MNEIIKAVEDLNVDTLIETSPLSALYTVEAIELEIEDQIRCLAKYREQMIKHRADVERKVSELTLH